VSKPSAVENRYFEDLAMRLQIDWRPCPIYPNLRAVERSHPCGFETRHGVTHAELVKRQWEALRLSPGPWMFEGMVPKRAVWLGWVPERVVDKFPLLTANYK